MCSACRSCSQLFWVQTHVQVPLATSDQDGPKPIGTEKLFSFCILNQTLFFSFGGHLAVSELEV